MVTWVAVEVVEDRNDHVVCDVSCHQVDCLTSSFESVPKNQFY